MAAVDVETVARASPQAAAARVRHPLTVLLLTLTFSTGLVDRVSYLRQTLSPVLGRRCAVGDDAK